MPRLMMCFIDAENYVNKTTNYSATIHKHKLSYDNIVYLKTKHYNSDAKLLLWILDQI